MFKVININKQKGAYMKYLILTAGILISGSVAFAHCGNCAGDSKNEAKHSCSKDKHKDHKKHSCSKDKKSCKKKHAKHEH